MPKLLALSILFFLPAAVNADSLTVQFNIACCTSGGYNFDLKSSGGSLTLTLVSSGEISADVVSNRGSILVFGYQGNGAPNHDFSPITPPNPISGITGLFGDYSDGFGCLSAPAGCGQEETFLIGNPGEFSSVNAIVGTIGGGADTANPLSANFFLALLPGGEANEFGADVSQTPEPASIMTFALGLLAFISPQAIRRRRQSL